MCVMGIMLLLTLMMCLQITSSVVSAGASPVDQTLDDMRELAAELAAEVTQLQQSASDQMALLNSGAIEDPKLLKDRSLSLEIENQSVTDNIRELWQQQDSSQTSLDSIQNTAKTRHAQIAQTKTLRSENRKLNKSLDELKRGDRVVYNAHDSSAATCWLVELTDLRTIQVAEMGKSGKPLTFSSRSDLELWMIQRHRSGAVFLILVKPDAAELLEPLTEQLRAQNVVFGFDLLPQNRVAIDPVTGAAAQ